MVREVRIEVNFRKGSKESHCRPSSVLILNWVLFTWVYSVFENSLNGHTYDLIVHDASVNS